MSVIEEYRRKIDKIDDEMRILFEQRMKFVEIIAEYKKEKGINILNKNREDEVIRKNASNLTNPNFKKYYINYIKNIMSISKSYQEELFSTTLVGYQGVEGAFSQIAAKEFFPNDKLISYKTFLDVFTAIEQGAIKYGIVPLENTSSGDIGGVLDLMFENNLYIYASFSLSVNQNLLVIPGTKLDDIKEIYSHEQALAQVESFLKGLNVLQIPCANTAIAAQLVAESKDKSKAAIASIDTAALYNLEVLISNVNTSNNNITRFVVLSKELNNVGNHFSICVSIKNEVGSLLKIIQLVSSYGYNMTKISSRPLKTVNFEYFFVLEIQGDYSTKGVELMKELNKKASKVKLLGIYDRT